MARQSASVRTRTIVDVKDKRSPKAFERVLWARGMQLALGCDRAIVATTDRGAKIVRFAHQQKVGLLTRISSTGFRARSTQATAFLKPDAWPVWLGEEPADEPQLKALLAP
jgi:hypothetical protein